MPDVTGSAATLGTSSLLALAAAAATAVCGCSETRDPPTSPTSARADLHIVSASGKRVGKNMGNQPMLEVRVAIRNGDSRPVKLFILEGNGMKYGPTELDRARIRLEREENPGMVVPHGLGLEQRLDEAGEWRAASTVWTPEDEPPKRIATMHTAEVALAPGQTRVFLARVLAPEDPFGARFFRTFLVDPNCIRFDEMQVSY